MPYLVKYGNEVLYEPASDSRAIHNATLQQKADGFSTFKFTIPPTHPLINTVDIYDADSAIEVSYDGVILFRGTATSITELLTLEKEVNCESELAYLNRVYTRYAPSDKRASTALAELIAIYNSYANLWGSAGIYKFLFAIDPESRADEVGYIDPDSNVQVVDAETSSPDTILNILKTSILDDYGAFLRVRYDGNGNRLIGVFPDAPDTSTQVVTFGENMIDYRYTISDENMFNACFPIGGASDELMAESPQYLVLAADTVPGQRQISLRTNGGTATVSTDGIMLIGKYSFVAEPNGSVTIGTSPVSVTVDPVMPYVIPAGTAVKYVGHAPLMFDGTTTLGRLPEITVGEYAADFEIVYHIDTVNRRGLKCTTYQDNNIKDARVLLNKSIAMLDATLQPTVSLTVKAIDMAFYASGYQHLQAGQRLRVISPPHGIDAFMYVSQADLNLDDPGQTVYTLGTRDKSITRNMTRANNGIKNVRDNVIVELNNRIPSSVIGGLT